MLQFSEGQSGGLLRFDAWADVELAVVGLFVRLDGKLVKGFTEGTQGWMEGISVSVPAGHHVLEFSYDRMDVESRSFITGSVFVDNVHYFPTSLIGSDTHYKGGEYGFEGGHFEAIPWIPDDSIEQFDNHAADWVVQASETYDGAFAARSGELNGELDVSSNLSLKLHTLEGGFLTFKYYEDLSMPFDSMIFLMDGVAVLAVSEKSGDWMSFKVGLIPGEHVLTWSMQTAPTPPLFERTVNYAVYGTGSAYIDQILFEPIVEMDPDRKEM